MLLVNIAHMKVTKIKYEKSKLYYYWSDSTYDGWDECVLEIQEEYERLASIESEKILLGEL